MEHRVAQAVTVKVMFVQLQSKYTALLKHFYTVLDWRALGRTKQYVRRLPVFVQKVKIKLYLIVHYNHFAT